MSRALVKINRIRNARRNVGAGTLEYAVLSAVGLFLAAIVGTNFKSGATTASNSVSTIAVSDTGTK